MKKLTIICGFAALLAAAPGCAKKDGIDDDLSFLNSAASNNIGKIFDISTDNSGVVKFYATGEGVASSAIDFGHGTGTGASATITAGNVTSHTYPEGNYTVTIVSTDIAGKPTSNTYPLEVKYRAPENVEAAIGHNANSISVTAKAMYAASYIVYFGEDPNDAGTPLAADGTVYHAYSAPGTYNVRVVAISGNPSFAGAAKTEITTQATIDPFSFGLPITFEDAGVNYFFGTFGDNQQFATVANPKTTGLNTSAKVGKFTRGNQSWSGTYSPQNFLIDLTTTKKLKVLVYTTDSALLGKNLNVELESAYTGTPANGVAVLKSPITKIGTWEELVFDYSTVAALPPGSKFGQLVLRLNDAFDGAGPGGAGSVIYLDNFSLTN